MGVGRSIAYAPGRWQLLQTTERAWVLLGCVPSCDHSRKSSRLLQRGGRQRCAGYVRVRGENKPGGHDSKVTDPLVSLLIFLEASSVPRPVLGSGSSEIKGSGGDKPSWSSITTAVLEGT